MSDAARWQRVQELFERALEVEGEARESWLRDACGGDEGLLSEVSSLLDADERGNAFLDSQGF